MLIKSALIIKSKKKRQNSNRLPYREKLAKHTCEQKGKLESNH